MNSGCAAALDRLQDFCFMAIKAANREPCTPPRSTLILTPAFVVYTELGIDPKSRLTQADFAAGIDGDARTFWGIKEYKPGLALTS